MVGLLKGVYHFFEVVFNVILTVLAAVFVCSLSFLCIFIFWWLLLLPQYRRIPSSYWIFIRPWVFFVNKVALLMRLRIIGKENIDRNRVALYISNHQSWIDIPVLIGYTGTPGISKQEVMLIPFIGILTAYGGAVFFDRRSTSARIQIIKKVLDVLKKGYPLCLFPEGTRSTDGSILDPNLALVKMCFKNNIDVVPCVIEGTREILPPKRLYLRFFRKVIFECCKPIHPSAFTNADDFADACWNKVKDTHTEVVNKYF